MKTKTIILAIKPKWVKLILSGEKTIEVRNKVPDTIKKVYIYASAPISRVMGEFEVSKIIQKCPLFMTNDELSKSAFKKNFKEATKMFDHWHTKAHDGELKDINLIYIKKPREWTKRFSIQAFGFKRAPQNYYYLDANKFHPIAIRDIQSVLSFEDNFNLAFGDIFEGE